VKHQSEYLQSALDTSQAISHKQVEAIIEDDAQYNVGPIKRNTNIPTFALQVVLPSNVRRFEFHKASESIIEGVPVWEVGFRETRGPTLIHDGNNNEEFAQGTLWIEPETGRIFKTDIKDKGYQRGRSFSTETVVSYRNAPVLGILVPLQMNEHYDLNERPILDCQADYSNFRRLQVNAEFNFGPESPGSEPPAPKPPPKL
jgi:hypothetical protein